MITVLYWIIVIIALTIVQRYFIYPILYWSGAILDDFNCSALGGDKWWFSRVHSKTVKDFINYRKEQTALYAQYEYMRWIPFIGILCGLLYLAVILIGTIFVWLYIIIMSIIIPIIIFIYDYIIAPFFSFIKKIIIKICHLLGLNKLSNNVNGFHNRFVEKILNINLH